MLHPKHDRLSRKSMTNPPLQGINYGNSNKITNSLSPHSDTPAVPGEGSRDPPPSAGPIPRLPALRRRSRGKQKPSSHLRPEVCGPGDPGAGQDPLPGWHVQDLPEAVQAALRRPGAPRQHLRHCCCRLPDGQEVDQLLPRSRHPQGALRADPAAAPWRP